jgi:hypothetical protein
MDTPADSFSVTFTDPKNESPIQWFETLEEAKAVLGDRPGIIRQKPLHSEGSGENVLQQ